jgi:hypothetical protein
MDWKAVVKSVAPILGTVLGGPLAGTAVKVLAEGLLGNPNASEQEVAAAVLSASPDQLLKLRELDANFKIKMRELNIDVFRLEVADRQSARDLAKVDMRPQMILSSLYTLGYFTMLYLFMTGNVEVATSLTTEFNIVLGVMTAAQTMIMQFWFGSSSGSKEKDVA